MAWAGLGELGMRMMTAYDKNRLEQKLGEATEKEAMLKELAETLDLARKALSKYADTLPKAAIRIASYNEDSWPNTILLLLPSSEGLWLGEFYETPENIEFENITEDYVATKELEHDTLMKMPPNKLSRIVANVREGIEEYLEYLYARADLLEELTQLTQESKSLLN